MQIFHCKGTIYEIDIAREFNGLYVRGTNPRTGKMYYHTGIATTEEEIKQQIFSMLILLHTEEYGAGLSCLEEDITI